MFRRRPALKIKINHPNLGPLYQKHDTFHEGDAGLDLFAPEDVIIPAQTRGYVLNLGIQCEMVLRYHTGYQDRGHNGGTLYVPQIQNLSYYLYARSSLGTKTPLRMANCVGIIDAGYRG